MSEMTAGLIELQARIADDANRAKDRDEYLRLVARYQEVSRLVLLAHTLDSETATDRARLSAAQQVLDSARTGL